jgi:hypothetical protein
MTARISTRDGKYWMHGIYSPRVEDCSNGHIMFTFRKPKRIALFDRIVNADGTELTFRFHGTRPEEMIMELVGQDNAIVVVLKWVPPVRPRLYSFPLGQATVPLGPSYGDTALLVGVAFQVFQWRLLPKGSG